MGTYSYSPNTSADVINFTATKGGTYTIAAYGGAGGAGENSNGGSGAEVGGTFVLQAGERLKIIVGGAGASGYGGGGGGASTVLADVDAQGNLTPGTYSAILLVAGGGGGGTQVQRNGGDGSSANGAPGGAGGGAGGAGGSGGGAGAMADGGGAGNSGDFVGGGGGRAAANGSAGGAGGAMGGRGGFGGGGGGSFYGGGGGGGYTGGSGNGFGGSSLYYGPGRGGTSFVAKSATSVLAVSGQNGGAGRVVINFACFCSGTLIRTARGDVAVEDLAVGDPVITASGEDRPIRWIGQRTMDLRRHARPHEVMPIRIAAHAFGENRPARDLRLSPGHPVLVGADDNGEGGHLVPIMCLVNGTTVRRECADVVTYWHVELDAHDILLAENLPAESYIDLGTRPWFAGADGLLSNPDLVLAGEPGRCRPVAVDGPMVEAERRRLDQVLTTRLAAACAWPGAEEEFFAARLVMPCAWPGADKDVHA